MIHQVYLPKVILPTIIVCINTVKFLIILPILMIFLVLSGYGIEVSWLAMPLLIALQLLMVWSLTSFCAALVPFVPDLRYVIENGLLLLMFVSGVFFDIDGLSGTIRTVLYLNPMAVLIDSYREVLLLGSWPGMAGLIYVLSFSIVFAVISWWLLVRFDRRYPKVL